MSTLATTNPPVRTWRDIQQTIAPKAMSSEGRKRLVARTAKSIAALVTLGFVGWGGFELMQTWEKNPMSIKTPVKSEPIKTIENSSDGVLDKAWVTRVLALPKNAGLMDVDLAALQSRLRESGQVRNAVLTRKFPATLVVMLEERWPVARIHAEMGDASRKDLLVARDGVIYEGLCYDQNLVNGLPYLADVTLKRIRGQFQPIPGMEKVAELLTTARVNVPDLFRNWQVVSLARYEADGFIVVHSKDIKDIIFGTRESDFYKQIAQLDLVVEVGRIQADHPAVSVNLAIGETQGGAQVPVIFENLPEAQPSSGKTVPTRPTPQAPVTRSSPQRPALFTSVFFPSREL
jgi:hypothetical protein